ncbi:MAG: nitroreductase family deazaflavin-dependent oxidoreductase [Actinomycetota bacterium]
MSLKHSLADAGLKTMNALHRTILKVSGGRLLKAPLGMPTVELHTIGRKSGQPRKCLLTAPIRDEKMTVLIASKGGDDRHPEWYLNLVANPEVELVVAGAPEKVSARTATPTEKAELWPRVTAAYKGYGSYQRRTERDIPVVICEPRP